MNLLEATLYGHEMQAASSGVLASPPLVLLAFYVQYTYTMRFMRRMNFHLTDQQFALLQALVHETGLSMAELLRRALDAYLQQARLHVVLPRRE